jgi:hypothetical protein
MKHGNGVNAERDQRLAEQIERELRSAFDIEPSPALLPRVRSRIEHLSPRPSLRWWIWGVPTAAVAMIVIVMVVSPRFSRTDISTARVPVEQTAQTSTSSVTPSGSLVVRPNVSARQESAVEPRRVSASRSAKPQANPVVVVRTNEQKAWQEFIAFASRGPIVVETTTTVASATPIESVRIAPVEVPAVVFEPQ